MIEITRSFGFDYGHRVLGHEGKCASLHGHRGLAEVSVAPAKGDDLDALGRVIDFGVVKELVGAWIDHHWDHSMILHHKDPMVRVCVDPSGSKLLPDIIACYFGPRQPFVMRENPTAENMAEVLYQNAAALLAPRNIVVTQIKLWETPNCFAIYRP